VLVSLNLAGEMAGQSGGGLVATPVKGRGAGAISRLVRADAWWRIPIGQGQFAASTSIQVQPTES
jgi:molybdopterin biosynthesis enzyme